MLKDKERQTEKNKKINGIIFQHIHTGQGE